MFDFEFRLRSILKAIDSDTKTESTQRLPQLAMIQSLTRTRSWPAIEQSDVLATVCQFRALVSARTTCLEKASCDHRQFSDMRYGTSSRADLQSRSLLNDNELVEPYPCPIG